MSQVTLNPAQTQAVIGDAGSAAGKNQGQTAPTTEAAPQTSAEPTDSVELSPAAQAPATASPTETLSPEDAQNASVNLRQQIGLYGLSASLAQNQSILSLLRRPG